MAVINLVSCWGRTAHKKFLWHQEEAWASQGKPVGPRFQGSRGLMRGVWGIPALSGGPDRMEEG